VSYIVGIKAGRSIRTRIITLLCPFRWHVCEHCRCL